MKLRQLIPLLLVLLLPTVAPAQGKTPPPTVVVRVSSIDSLIGHVKFLAGLAGQEDAARQIEGLIKTKIGPNGLEGVDSGRPFGFYGSGKDIGDISGVVLLPIADEKAFLNLLKNNGIQVVKGGDGIYTIKTGTPVDAYLRFASKYACVTALQTTALEDKNLLDPAKVLAGKATSAFALTIQLDHVPEAVKQIAGFQVDQVMEDIQNKKIPGESETERALRVAAVKEVGKIIGSVLKDGGELHTDVDLDQASGKLAATFSIAGVANSELAAGIAALAKTPAAFAGLMKSNSAFTSLGHVKLPESMVKAMGNLVDEAKSKALAGIQEAGKKQQAEALFKVLTPTLKGGDFDGALVVTQSGTTYTVLAAIKVQDGDALGTTIRTLINDSLKEVPAAQRDKIKLDADAVGATKIHKVEVPASNQDAKVMAAILGDLNLYLAFRNDAVFLSVGKNGLQAIKEAIPVSAAGKSPVLLYEVDVARLATLIPGDQAAAKAKQSFPGGAGGVVRFSVEGGSALTVRLQLNVAVLQFLGQMRQLQGAN